MPSMRTNTLPEIPCLQAKCHIQTTLLLHRFLCIWQGISYTLLLIPTTPGIAQDVLMNRNVFTSTHHTVCIYVNVNTAS